MNYALPIFSCSLVFNNTPMTDLALCCFKWIVCDGWTMMLQMIMIVVMVMVLEMGMALALALVMTMMMSPLLSLSITWCKYCLKESKSCYKLKIFPSLPYCWSLLFLHFSTYSTHFQDIPYTKKRFFSSSPSTLLSCSAWPFFTKFLLLCFFFYDNKWTQKIWKKERKRFPSWSEMSVRSWK